MHTPHTLGEALQRGAALWPDAVYAVAVDGAGSITHAELLREAAVVAAQLHELGLRATAVGFIRSLALAPSEMLMTSQPASFRFFAPSSSF